MYVSVSVCMYVCVCVCVLCVCVCVCVNFQAKQIALTFLDYISPKMYLGLETQKTIFEIRIIILKILCQFSGRTNNFDLFL